ncbi:MAG: FAD-dependent oxidoreductase [Fimbriimonadaceae bacterium]|nr:FAD-dependent oxidoreductase [Fimbriimonadaceae bacterium]
MSTTTIQFQRHLPLRADVDVLVAGGGPAGMAAAVTAAEAGASVYLAEAHTCLGGMGTAAQVPVWMPCTDGINFLAGGFGRRVVEALRAATGDPLCQGIDSEALKRVYDQQAAAAGVELSFQTRLVAVEVSGGRVQHVVCAAPSGLFAVRAQVYVDCTGNGDLAAWAGAAYEKGDDSGDLMPGTLCSVWCDIDWETWLAARSDDVQPDGQWLREAYEAGVFRVLDEHLTGMFRKGAHLGGGNIGHTFGVDGTDERSLTAALLEGRRQLAEYERYYREYVPGFERVRLVASGALLGVRETRRIRGEYTLTLDDYLDRASFDDEIGRYAYSIDNHPTRPGSETYQQHRQEFDRTFRYGPGESYGIPYRCLTPRDLTNVLVAGRCVSVDRMVHGSLRVMPGCFITGQAAGMAAALARAHDGQVKDVPVPLLRERLRAVGAYLPEA